MDILGNLFGSSGKVRIMRLFLFNPSNSYEAKDVAERTQTRSNIARKEIKHLLKIKMIKKNSFRNVAKKRVSGWTLNSDFQYVLPLQNLLVNITVLQHKSILKRFNKIGKLKSVVLAGMFIQDWDSRADILLVADKIKRKPLENVIRHLEAEIGKEIKYTALDTSEFQYRFNMGDKLIRDILDYPHEVALDKLGIH